MLSIRRAMGAPSDTAAETIDLLIALDQRPFSKIAPDGWPETAGPWLNLGGMLTRFDIATRIVNGDLPSIPVEAWPPWKALVDQPFDTQVDGVIRELLSGQVSESTRAVLVGSRPAAEGPDTSMGRERTLRELISLALSSPEFQRR